MRERERRHGEEQRSQARWQEYDAEQEEQVIGAPEDVLDAEPQVFDCGGTCGLGRRAAEGKHVVPRVGDHLGLIALASDPRDVPVAFFELGQESEVRSHVTAATFALVTGYDDDTVV